MPTVYELNKDKISSLNKDIEEKSSYSKESVNDNPNNVDYIKVKMDTKTYYVYERNGKTYIEEPYNGIWKIPSDLYKTIKNNKDKLIVEYEDYYSFRLYITAYYMYFPMMRVVVIIQSLTKEE